MIIDVLSLYQKNPWWESPKLIDEDDKLKDLSLQKYVYLHPILDAFPLGKYGVATLRGPRQIGKTTLVKQLIQKLLLTHHIPPKTIFYYSGNTLSHFEELKLLLDMYFQEFGGLPFYYVFLDEISFIREWQRTIKEYTEGEYGRKTLFFLTGSSTVDLKFSGERLPGRRGNIKEKDILFLPLKFHEYLPLVLPESEDWQGQEKLHLPKVRRVFQDFLITGGFPAVLNQYYQHGFITNEISDIYLSWIVGDLHKMGKSEKIADAIWQKLFTSLSTPLSYWGVAKETSLASYTTAFEYLNLFEHLLILFTVDYFDLSSKKAYYKKNHKFYFCDSFIALSLLAKINNMRDEQFSFSQKRLRDPNFIPKFIENIVASHLREETSLLYYGKAGERETDFVVKKKEKLSYIEVKYQNNVSPSDFSWFRENFPKEKLTVVTKNTYWEGKNITLLPLELFLLKNRISPSLTIRRS